MGALAGLVGCTARLTLAVTAILHSRQAKHLQGRTQRQQAAVMRGQQNAMVCASLETTYKQIRFVCVCMWFKGWLSSIHH